jgi:hypothetical protein
MEAVSWEVATSPPILEQVPSIDILLSLNVHAILRPSRFVHNRNVARLPGRGVAVWLAAPEIQGHLPRSPTSKGNRHQLSHRNITRERYKGYFHGGFPKDWKINLPY